MERFLKIGTVAPRNSKQIEVSPMGVGMEKLDRDTFDPEKVYDKVAALGVKWVRLQSGWQKTEKEEGVYDFAWLDGQVDALRSRGLIPWLCLCYGNRLYDGPAGEYFGAVGCPPIRSERAYAAWQRYAEATVRHFAGRVEYYEIWNEPEGNWTWRPLPNTDEYVDFCRKTGRAILNGDPNAKIIVGSHFQNSMEFVNAELANGVMDFAHAVSYHSYDYDETVSLRRIRAFRSLIKHYGKNTEIIQGESGSQSRSGGGGAFHRIRTNQGMQTKYILRHAVAEVMAGVKFTSVFSSVDMAENLDAKAGSPISVCGYFGLLSADFDPTTGKLVGEYKEKPSYYAFRNLCALFDEAVAPEELPVIFKPKASERINGFDCAPRDLVYGGISKKNGAKAFAYWKSTELTTVFGYEGSVTFELGGVTGEIRLVDPMDGAVYRLNDGVVKNHGNGLYTFENLPVRDYPLILTFGEFFAAEEEGE